MTLKQCMRTICRLVNINILSCIEPIREDIRKNSLMYTFCGAIFSKPYHIWLLIFHDVDITIEGSYCTGGLTLIFTQTTGFTLDTIYRQKLKLKIALLMKMSQCISRTTRPNIGLVVLES